MLTNDGFGDGNSERHHVRVIVSDLLRLQSVSSGHSDLMVPALCTFLCNSSTTDISRSRSDVKGWFTLPDAVDSETRSAGPCHSPTVFLVLPEHTQRTRA